MNCAKQITTGIQDIFIRCQCDLISVCVGIDISPIYQKDTLEICGTKTELESLTGYKIKMTSMSELPIDLGDSCYKEVDLFVKARKGGYAAFSNVLLSYGGHNVGMGVWTHTYSATARKGTLTDHLPAPDVTVGYDNCLHYIETPCPIEGMTFTVASASDPDTIVETVQLLGGQLVTSTGVVLGNLDGFIMPVSDFVLEGTLISPEGLTQSFTLQSGNVDCPTISVQTTGAGDVDVGTVSPSAVYLVTYYNYSSGVVTETTLSGPQTISVTSAGFITISGCGIDEIGVGGDIGDINLGDSCVTHLDVSGSTATNIVGGSVTHFIGNGEDIAPCDWPLISYTDHSRVGTVDLSCWIGLLYADISFGAVTDIIPNPTVQELRISDNAWLNVGSAAICGFPDLRILIADQCNFTTFNFDCVPELRELVINNNPLSGWTNSGPNKVRRLLMHYTLNTTANFILMGNRFPLLEELWWDYQGIGDILRPTDWPLLRIFHMSDSTGDPNPFFWTFSPTAWSNLTDFTYELAPNVASDLNIILNSLVFGGTSGATINIATGCPPLDSTGCAHVANLVAAGCTVNYTAGGAC